MTLNANDVNAEKFVTVATIRCFITWNFIHVGSCTKSRRDKRSRRCHQEFSGNSKNLLKIFKNKFKQFIEKFEMAFRKEIKIGASNCVYTILEKTRKSIICKNQSWEHLIWKRNATVLLICSTGKDYLILFFQVVLYLIILIFRWFALSQEIVYENLSIFKCRYFHPEQVII